MRTNRWRIGSVLVLAQAVACGSETVGPVARIELTPTILCEGAPETSVIISGTGSRNTDGTSTGLHYAWRFSREPGRVIRGDVDQAEMVVAVATSVPLAVHLLVTDDAQGRAQSEQLLGLFRASLTPCEEGCNDHEICVAVDGRRVCVDDTTCVNAQACGCWTCRPDDSGTARCLPPGTVGDG